VSGALASLTAPVLPPDDPHAMASEAIETQSNLDMAQASPGTRKKSPVTGADGYPTDSPARSARYRAIRGCILT
jgi:hypothetical protein